jgi:hypothetical protein
MAERRTETNIFASADPEFVERVQAAEDEREHLGALVEKFGVPPFSELDCRSDAWQRINRAYIKRLGIRSELGRDSDVLEHSGSYAFTTDSADRIQKFHDHADKKPNVENICSEKWGRGQKSIDITPGGGGENGIRKSADLHALRHRPDVATFGSGNPGDLSAELKARKGYSYAAAENEGLNEEAQKALGCYAAPGGAVIDRNTGGITGTSIFPPALCHCMYLWFGKRGGSILDPFAGGSVRGIVAGYLGYKYTGVDIRAGQVEENQRQAKALAAEFPHFVMPKWIVGDSTDLLDVLDAARDPWEEVETYDMIFTCPPYYDLEIYSTNTGDGSTKQTYPEFLDWYESIFRQAFTRLKHNRFAVIVVGEVRNRESGAGGYHGLEIDTPLILARKLNTIYYNRIVLKTAVGSLPVRIGPQMNKYRKIGNTHQMIHCFWRGEDDRVAILRELGEIGGEYAG